MSHVPSYQPKPTTYGLLAEFESGEKLLAAAEKIRDAGFQKWDTFSPYPVHGMERAMGLKASVLPWHVLGAALTGLATAIVVQWYGNGVDYPWILSGKPFWSIPANIPIYFEFTVLLAGITAFGAVFLLSGLPRLHHPVFTSERFVAKGSTDGYFLEIEAKDPKFELEKTRELLASLGATGVETLED